MLVTCFVFARIDCLLRYDLNRLQAKQNLQAVQNAAVRLIVGARKFDHVTPLLRE